MEKIKYERVDLVITDVRMPGMDGIELCRQVKEYDDSIEIIIISGYNDFEYARKAIEYNVKAYLLKPVMPNELEEQLIDIKDKLDMKLELQQEERRKREILKDKLLYEFVSGYIDGIKRETDLKRYDIDLAHGIYNIALISVDVDEDKRHEESAKHQIRNTIESFVRQHRLGYVYEDINGMFGILILRQEPYDTDIYPLDRKFETLSSILEKDLGLRVAIGYGTYKTEPSNIKIARQEALQSLESRVLNKGKRVISYYDFAKKGEQLWNLKWDKDNFIKAVEEMDEESIHNQVDEFIENIISNQITKDILKSMLISIVWDLSVLIQRYNGDVNRVFDHTALDEIDDVCRDINKMKDWAVKMSRETHGYIIELKSQSTKSLIEHVVEYIDANYCQDITLSQIADKFYVSHAYLGQLFKEKTGVFFSQYINTKRIEKAKELYMTGRFKVYEIIEKVGYKHSEYFYRQFKKCEGITFAEFRNRVENTQAER